MSGLEWRELRRQGESFQLYWSFVSCASDALFASIAAGWNMHVESSHCYRAYKEELAITLLQFPKELMSIIIGYVSPYAMTSKVIHGMVAEATNQDNRHLFNEWPALISLEKVRSFIRDPAYEGESPAVLEVLSQHPLFAYEQLGLAVIAEKDRMLGTVLNCGGVFGVNATRFILLYHANNHFKLLAYKSNLTSKLSPIVHNHTLEKHILKAIYII